MKSESALKGKYCILFLREQYFPACFRGHRPPAFRTICWRLHQQRPRTGSIVDTSSIWQFWVIVPDILEVALVVVVRVAGLALVVEVVPGIMRPPMVMQRLNRPPVVVLGLLAAVTINATMAFFAVVIAQWVNFFFVMIMLLLLLLIMMAKIVIAVVFTIASSLMASKVLMASNLAIAIISQESLTFRDDMTFFSFRKQIITIFLMTTILLLASPTSSSSAAVVVRAVRESPGPVEVEHADQSGLL
jgi:hypothetical protein